MVRGSTVSTVFTDEQVHGKSECEGNEVHELAASNEEIIEAGYQYVLVVV